MTWALRKFYVSWNLSFQQLFPKVTLGLLMHLERKIGAGIVHGEEDAKYVQLWVKGLLNKGYCL